MLEYGMTFRVVCETDASAGRAMATNNEADLGTKMIDLTRMTSLLKGTPLQPPMGWSSWMVATTLHAVATAAKDCRVSIWNARNMCETNGWFWICVGMVIAILTVMSGGLTVCISHFRRLQSAEGDRQECCVATSNKNEPKHHETVFQIQTAWNPVVNGVACGMGSASIVWTAAPSILSM